MSGIGQPSEAASLALHSMALMARKGPGLTSARQIAEETGFSEAHLSKVLQRLVRAELAHSVRGPRGGFSLAAPPHMIGLLDIYEAIEGPLKPNRCSMRDRCSLKSCLFSDVRERLVEEFRSYLQSHTLADFPHAE